MHEPVLLKEVSEFLVVRKGGTYIDGTAGGGGHLNEIRRKSGEGSRVLGIDRDLDAVDRLRNQELAPGCEVVHGNFADMADIAREKGIQKVDGILLDLGLSSYQLADAERGFSFREDGPLDMRMDPTAGKTAADLVAELSERELEQGIREFGEERAARRVARAIVRERVREKIETTGRLAALIERTIPRRGRIHPATRTFQALRIMVNHELDFLEKGLTEGLSLLVQQGRMAVISFHSLEDRIVKKCFSNHVGRRVSLQAGGDEWRGEEPRTAWVNKKPVTPDDEEIRKNPRSRSAKLRVVERI